KIRGGGTRGAMQGGIPALKIPIVCSTTCKAPVGLGIAAQNRKLLVRSGNPTRQQNALSNRKSGALGPIADRFAISIRIFVICWGPEWGVRLKALCVAQGLVP